MTNHRWAILLSLSVWLLLSAENVCADAIIVAPNGLANQNGNTDNLIPFDISNPTFNLPSARYQQVYASSQFALLGGPQLITQIAFRPHFLSGSAFSSVLPDIQINLSTTHSGVDALSNVFTNNVGLNDVTVYSGALPLSSAFTGPQSGPKDFDIVINLKVAFLYDPAAGNLLLDVRNFGGGLSTFFDAQLEAADGVSRVFTGFNGVGNVNSPTGTTDTLGLVTQFHFQQVPEPSAVWVSGIVCAMMLAWVFGIRKFI